MKLRVAKKIIKNSGNLKYHKHQVQKAEAAVARSQRRSEKKEAKDNA